MRGIKSGGNASSPHIRQHHENTKAELPHEKNRLKRRNEGLGPSAKQSNATQVMGSTNAPDVKVNGQISGVVVNVMDPAKGGGLDVKMQDPTAPASYKSELGDRLGVHPDSYKGAANTKAEYGVERHSRTHKFKGSAGDIVANLNTRKRNYAFVNEKLEGKRALEASGELAYTSGSLQTEGRHVGVYDKNKNSPHLYDENKRSELPDEKHRLKRRNEGFEPNAGQSKAKGKDDKNVHLHDENNRVGVPNEKHRLRRHDEGLDPKADYKAKSKDDKKDKIEYGTTEWKATVDGPFAKAGGEVELRASKQKGQEALAAHAKLEASAGLFSASATVDHKYKQHLGVGAHASAQASAFSSSEVSAVADRAQGTYMFKASSANIAGVQAAVGGSLKVGPFQGDLTVGKLGGVGYVANVGGGLNRGVATAVLDLGGALGPGGRIRAGVSVDTAHIKHTGRDLHNKLTNEKYSSEVSKRSTMPTLEERVKFQKQVAEENLLFQKAQAHRPAPQIKLENELPAEATGSLGIDASKIGK